MYIHTSILSAVCLLLSPLPPAYRDTCPYGEFIKWVQCTLKFGACALSETVGHCAQPRIALVLHLCTWTFHLSAELPYYICENTVQPHSNATRLNITLCINRLVFRVVRTVKSPHNFGLKWLPWVRSSCKCWNFHVFCKINIFCLYNQSPFCFGAARAWTLSL